MIAASGRAQEYLDSGVVVVWVVDPLHRNVVEYRRVAAARIWAEDDVLTVEDIFPGFAVRVRNMLQE